MFLFVRVPQVSGMLHLGSQAQTKRPHAGVASDVETSHALANWGTTLERAGHALARRTAHAVLAAPSGRRHWPHG